MDQIDQKQVTGKCERKVVRKFALIETQKLTYSLYPIGRANEVFYFQNCVVVRWMSMAVHHAIIT